MGGYLHVTTFTCTTEYLNGAQQILIFGFTEVNISSKNKVSLAWSGTMLRLPVLNLNTTNTAQLATDSEM